MLNTFLSVFAATVALGTIATFFPGVFCAIAVVGLIIATGVHNGHPNSA